MGFVKTDNTAALTKALRALTAQRVVVGIPEDGPTRSTGDLSNAALGYIQENGAPEINLPARPFLEPGVRAVTEEATKRLRAAATAALNGNLRAPSEGLAAVGQMAVASVQGVLDHGVSPPLAPRTIAGRRRAGNASTTPLLDTKEMRDAIAYRLRKADP